MATSKPRRRLGLAAFAFDRWGQKLLDTVADRPDLGDALVLCHFFTEGDGGGEASGEAPDGEVPSGGTPPIWLQRQPGMAWTPPPWAAEARSCADGFRGAVKEALATERWRSVEGGVDQVDLLLIVPVETGPEEGLPQGTLSALRSLRRRYKKLGRLMLLVSRELEMSGQTGIQGKLSPLPFASGQGGGDLFSPILLFDHLDTNGNQHTDEEILRQAAAAVVQLTVGELHDVLYSQFQRQAAQIQNGGHYVSFGVSEWRLDPERMANALATILYRDMATLLASRLETAPAEDASGTAEIAVAGDDGDIDADVDDDDDGSQPETDEAETPPPTVTSGPNKSIGDPWVEELRTSIDQLETDEREAETETLVARWGETIRDLSIEKVTPLVQGRKEAAASFAKELQLELIRFQPCFARWYSRKQAGLEISEPDEPYTISEPGEPYTSKESKPRVDRMIACAASGVLALMSGGAAYRLPEVRLEFGIAAVIFLFIAFGIAALGLQKEVTPEVPEKKQVIGNKKVKEDLEPKLAKLRARFTLADEMARWGASIGIKVEAAVQDLRNTGDPRGEHSDTFPCSPAVCTVLLERADLRSQPVLDVFWRERGTPLVQNLPHALPAQIGAALRDYAAERCRDVPPTSWRSLLDAPDGSELLADPQLFQNARDAAAPKVPVPGSVTFKVLALPRTLPEPMRAALRYAFPDQVVHVETEGEAVLVVGMTQGYLPGEEAA